MKFYDFTGLDENLSRQVHSKFYQNFTNTKNYKDADMMLCGQKSMNFWPEKKTKYMVCNCTNTLHLRVPSWAKLTKLTGKDLGAVTSTAEHTIYLMMRLIKRSSREEKPGHVLNRKTAYLIGNRGRVAKQLFKGLPLFNMNVVGSDLGGINHDFLKRADFVSVHVSVNQYDKPVLNEELISELKCGAYVINTSRPQAVDTRAMLKHIKRLGGFASDFHLPFSLTSKPNVVVTEHCGGYCIEDLKKTSDICYEKFMMEVACNL